MSLPAELLDLIRRWEGLRLKVYLCPAGVATIGYGHTGPDVKMGMPPISKDVAEALMVKDASRFYFAAAKLSPVLWLYPGAHAAISDFCFNLGETRYKASTLKKCIDKCDWEGAEYQLGRWVMGGGKRLPGLVARRSAEALLLPK